MNEWKIYTRKGDSGFTQLLNGKIVPKSHFRIDAYGHVDELVSFMGLLRDVIEDEDEKQFLLGLQEDLFCIEAYLACDQSNCAQILPHLPVQKVSLIEQRIDWMEQQLPPLSNFVIPGGLMANSLAHICRTIARRSERAIAHLHQMEPVPDAILQYINRLSDYFFVLARFLTYQKSAVEIIWKGMHQS